MMKREHFSSRLGFILITAACSIGLGNIWRFPYITGKYGGASFVLLYMVFLVILGLPIVVMEFAVRAGQPEKHGPLLPPAGAGGDKMALVQVRHHHRELSADDVLYRHQRLAVLLLY